MGVKELIPPNLGDGLQLDDLLSGVAFASGGSGYDPLTSKITVQFYFLELMSQYKLLSNYYPVSICTVK